MRREFPVGPHDDGRLLEPQGRDPVHHRRDPQARGFPLESLSSGSLTWGRASGPWTRNPGHLEPQGLEVIHLSPSARPPGS